MSFMKTNVQLWYKYNIIDSLKPLKSVKVNFLKRLFNTKLNYAIKL